MDEMVYCELANKARTHFSESRLGKLAHVSDYDPDKETHNFKNVYFEARPNRMTPVLFGAIAGAVAKSKNPRFVKEHLAKPFEGQVEEAIERLENGSLCIITGHQTMFEPGFIMYGLQRAIQAKTGENYADIAKDTHLIAARALTTVDLFGKWPLISLARQITNIYCTFPRTDNYGDLPESFKKSHNRRMLAKFLSQTREVGSLAVLSASATTERKNDYGENVVPRVKEGTMKLLQRGADVWPIGGRFKNGNIVIEPGKIIPADKVTHGIIHDEMERVVVGSRNKYGVPSVYQGSLRGLDLTGFDD